MRALIQRTTDAHVEVSGGKVARIGLGLVILLGVEAEDSQEDVEWLAGKITRLRIFSDDQGNMNHSVLETAGEVLVVSQFTLHASTKKGNRPSFVKAARPEQAALLYTAFVKRMEELLEKQVQTGIFGKHMQVRLVNDGPVTIWIDTKNKE